jgi:hypothetical protein
MMMVVVIVGMMMIMLKALMVVSGYIGKMIVITMMVSRWYSDGIS